jgi:NADH:ubiquinone oxidoreductase subunit 6 (subunit J)
MDITTLTFYIFAIVCVGSAGFIVFTKNIIHAAFALMATFLSIAAIYVFAGADFIAITQIMVYVGGILILIVFGVMLTNRLSGKALKTSTSNYFFGFLVGVGLLIILLRTILSVDFYTVSWMNNNNRLIASNTSKQLGLGLMSDYLLIFEIVAVLLLVALIGAVILAGKKIGSNKTDIGRQKNRIK